MGADHPWPLNWVAVYGSSCFGVGRVLGAWAIYGLVIVREGPQPRRRLADLLGGLLWSSRGPLTGLLSTALLAWP